ncbi:MAG TPA: DPP IV N-terminal domain-containing protein [Chloroflexota bacterium]|nr:DPP IV N-terminal domain-containing protein [Chloroflexota bacterium]
MVRVALALVVLLLATQPASAQTAQLQGRILFVKDGDLWLWQDSGAHPLATGGTWSQPTWSPAGDSLAYVYRGQNFADIFVTDDQGQSQQRLTDSQSSILENNDWNLRPTWSPDGSQIAFVSDRATTFPVLWLMDAADGSGRHQLATPGLIQDAVDSLAWSPDGSELAATFFNEPGPSQIVLIPMATSGRQLGHVLTSAAGGALDPAWSPDGAWLAYAGHDGATVEVHAVHPDGSEDQVLTHDGFLVRSPVFSPDGRHIAYLSSRTGFFEVWLIDLSADASGAFSASKPRQLTQDLHIDAASGLSWGP